MEEEIIKGCKGCVYYDYSQCAFLWGDEEDITDCPCRTCLVKPMCTSGFTCEKRWKYSNKVFDRDEGGRKTARLWANYR
jgi:hypothetical protein